MGLCSSKQSDEVAKEPEVKEAEKVEEEVPKEDEPKKAEEEPVEKEEEPKEAEAEPTSEEEVVQCAKVWLGQIIGPGGSTLKELQESTGANIDVAQGEEDPVPITITGSPGAVADAKQKIEAIIKEAENPDYEGEEGKKWREEADNCAKKAEECAKEKDALEEVVQCAKVWLGQIIGPGGSTLKELQESTGANIDVAQGEEDPVPITITGSPGAVADAKQKIEAIIKEAENPDYEGEEGKKWREEADMCAKKAEECAKEKDALFDSGDKAGGHAKLDEVKEWQRKMHEANDKAAEAIFDHRNAGKGDRYMDFHGLRKKEAMDILEKKMAVLEGKGGEVELIPGAGNHSSGGVVLKPAVISFLKEKGLKFEENNGGIIMVTL
eukprot:CAMPEP_0185740896 /NCGR_PEP_ID=MMETSP1171-20130828/38667_1 /TAXON_ID=374046 /ORGANISM="Helicotheca tamensis, Strain CCMP826" /LENGTH=380 /DNA_ID=CAMNT_0028412827 /DNA_START=82 /DNA_END=1223 /DNA_ORIENTATION=-